MATLSPAPIIHEQPAHERHHSQTDSLWQSTPRTTLTSQELELLMAAQQIVAQAPAHTQQKTNQDVYRAAVPRHARAPMCTHVTMNRLYGEHTCSMCGKVPSLGWVYSCQQDRLLCHPVPDMEALPIVSDDGDYFEAQAKVAEALCMSSSVIKQMRRGEYSFDQMEILLQQRRHVLEVIKKAENPSSRSTPTISASPVPASSPAENIIASVGSTAPAVQQSNISLLPMSPAGTPSNTPVESTVTTPVKAKKAKRLTCNFQVCHACRPFLRDRVPMGFEPALNNELPAVTESEISKLPILDPSIVRNLGLRQPPKALQPIQTQDIADANMHQGDGNEDESEDWTPSSATSSAYYSDDGDDPYPCPGPGICPVTNGSGLCAYDAGFDDGKRAYHHGFAALLPQATARLHRVHANVSISPVGTSSTGSSISLPEPKTEPLTPPTPNSLPFEMQLASKLRKAGNAPIFSGAVTGEEGEVRPGSRSASTDSSSSSVGSEVEVEGGVALTEEAVESGRPDIATE